MNRLKLFGDNYLYWIGLILLGLSMEAVALYYQYVLEEWPCVLCIHIRIWVAGFILVAVLALLLNRLKGATTVFHFLNSLVMLGFVERSWQALAVERGWVFGNCNMDAGLPDWFQLNQWLPAMFEVKAACGYTPLVFLNTSMAEILMLASVLLLGLSLILSVASYWPNEKA
ncbi:MAG: disulfide bond formation protein DsbB [Gammaproteobacteria bacterium]|jgi:disulfide bond formation protein DsbB